MNKIIDTHCHLFEDVFIKDFSNILERCQEHEISKILVPNLDLNTVDTMLNMCKQHSEICFPMIGLHPCYVDENFKNTLHELENYFSKNSFIGIGETGLDFYHSTTFKSQQIQSLHTQLEWAAHYNLPVSLHSRSATQELINLIKKDHKNIRGVFHCFSESIELANQIIDLGFYLGIGGVVTYKNASIVETLKYVSLDKIVLETDAPYLPPVPYRGKRNEPCYLSFVVEKLAQVYMLSPEKIKEQTEQNAMRIFFNSTNK